MFTEIQSGDYGLESTVLICVIPYTACIVTESKVIEKTNIKWFYCIILIFGNKLWHTTCVIIAQWAIISDLVPNIAQFPN